MRKITLINIFAVIIVLILIAITLLTTLTANRVPDSGESAGSPPKSTDGHVTAQPGQPTGNKDDSETEPDAGESSNPDRTPVPGLSTATPPESSPDQLNTSDPPSGASGQPAGNPSREAEKLVALEDILKKRFANFLPQSLWSVYVIDLTTGDWAECLSGDRGEPTIAASLIKLFIAGAVFRAEKDGIFTLSAADLADMEVMIRDSDNESANRLTRKLGNGDSNAGMDKVTAWAQSIGCPDTKMSRLLNADRAAENRTTAKDCAAVLVMIANNEFIDKAASERMLGWMGADSSNASKASKIRAGISGSGISVYNKTGELPAPGIVENDAAIVRTADAGLVLCILSEPTSSAGAKSEIADLTKIILDYFKINS